MGGALQTPDYWAVVEKRPFDVKKTAFCEMKETSQNDGLLGGGRKKRPSERPDSQAVVEKRPFDVRKNVPPC